MQTTKDATAVTVAMLLPQKQQNMHMHYVTLHSGMWCKILLDIYVGRYCRCIITIYEWKVNRGFTLYIHETFDSS